MKRKSKEGFSPDYPVPAGYTLKEVLQDRRMTQEELAKRTGFPQKYVSAVIGGRSPISLEFAKKLKKVLGISICFWMELDFNYWKNSCKNKRRFHYLFYTPKNFQVK